MSIWAADLEPKLLTVLRDGYHRHDPLRDAMPGVVVGVVVRRARADR